MYGSSRLGTKDYLSGQHYALWDYTGAQPVVDSVKLNSRQPWYSQEYNDAISYLTTQPWGWTQNGSFYVQRQLGLKQYELNNHLGNVQATVTDNPVQQWSGSTWTHNMPALASAYDYYPFGMLMPGRYVSDTSVHCMTISTTQWVTTSIFPVRIYCEDCPLIVGNPYNGAQYYAQPALSGFDLTAPIGGGLDIELTVEPGVQNTFTFGVSRLSSHALARFAVLEDSLGTLRELTSELITKQGSNLMKFQPTGNTVILHISNEDLYNIVYISIVDWYKSQTKTVQETILVDVCDEDKDRYRFGFNGQEKVNEWSGVGNSLDFGARMLDTRIARWQVPDQYASKYPGYSPYNYVLNSPLSATDPDGNLVLFIGGLRLWVGQGDQSSYTTKSKNEYPGFYKSDVYNYWSTGKGQTNSFGKSANVAKLFTDKIGDNNVLFASGSSSWQSDPGWRMKQGEQKAREFHAMVQKGEIKLAKDETIKIISHSQGGAHAAGFANQLLSYKDKTGKPLYNIEVMYYITPHQPTRFSHPDGIRGVQYSHPSDAVSSDDPIWLPNGGSKYGKIEGVDEFYGDDIMGGKGQPPAEGPNGNRSGHNVTDNEDYIKQTGSIQPRQD